MTVLYYDDLTKFSRDVATLQNNAADWMIEALLEQAALIAGYAQVYVRVKTGALRDSIRVEAEDRTVKVAAGGGEVDYAWIVETRYPYMKPAFDSVEPSNVEKMKERIEERLG